MGISGLLSVSELNLPKDLLSEISTLLVALDLIKPR